MPLECLCLSRIALGAVRNGVRLAIFRGKHVKKRLRNDSLHRELSRMRNSEMYVMRCSEASTLGNILSTKPRPDSPNSSAKGRRTIFNHYPSHLPLATQDPKLPPPHLFPISGSPLRNNLKTRGYRVSLDTEHLLEHLMGTCIYSPQDPNFDCGTGTGYAGHNPIRQVCFSGYIHWSPGHVLLTHLFPRMSRPQDHFARFDLYIIDVFFLPVFKTLPLYTYLQPYRSAQIGWIGYTLFSLVLAAVLLDQAFLRKIQATSVTEVAVQLYF
ncbi:hypothetical protein BKA64DRAFT_463168 [Cadophora sp. MPI-SDFR-AT-0126]|nr:hypothetical protein BKA64DRAFT_463168 [Leotiomycetes sp. MPI-SDFR-AT-0126]